MKFTDICIFTENVIEMVKFYERIFEVEADKDKIHSVIHINGLTITFYDKIHAESLMGFDFSNSGNGMTYIGFDVDNLDEVYMRLQKLEVSSISIPTLWPWGAKSFNIEDIEGNRIMFRTWSND